MKAGISIIEIGRILGISNNITILLYIKKEKKNSHRTHCTIGNFLLLGPLLNLYK